MREDLKERLRKLANRIPVYYASDSFLITMFELWSGDNVTADTGKMFGDLWPHDELECGHHDEWPDSRVEAFLNWAEQTEDSNVEA